MHEAHSGMTSAASLLYIFSLETRRGGGMQTPWHGSHIVRWHRQTRPRQGYRHKATQTTQIRTMRRS